MFQVHLERVTEEEQLWTHSTQQISKYRVTHSIQGYLGDLYLDLYSRPSKQMASAMYTIRGRCEDLHGAIQHPIGVIVSHIPFGGCDQNSIIEMNMIPTLYHEFGHAMQLLLTDTKFVQISGTRVAVGNEALRQK
ncbi:mitochondrial intermediate peptidase [Blastocystis sp. subtype 4]|uniref:mitochondrial intermediate peptidase n=1 Tax=Blastocystis sp. subtype 4 TaxID=944170 RepID=UPI00071219B3|nr:mitochondrial intermediate peptidase [Blastocystis sp. subtype 4]KNB46833.1 mitochondrial intermediate peptidase [Blastocystis sp. subtype 4]|eukprot:XP_014530276.1 mitochondrial intermediate peptidase [Blastocystis sp. subtype 4]